jgi:hypothetical protein
MTKRSQKDILRNVKALAVKYYRLTGKPLGVTGKVAEYEAAEKLDLELAKARTPGWDRHPSRLPWDRASEAADSRDRRSCSLTSRTSGDCAQPVYQIVGGPVGSGDRRCLIENALSRRQQRKDYSVSAAVPYADPS